MNLTKPLKDKLFDKLDIQLENQLYWQLVNEIQKTTKK
jgi:hypothetical protein